ncbi:MAG: hypothetical protein HYZ75_12210 [Elusimicrobia bacterium]|nr:hypothetical protein [Elusimicrobiota bacterium]
MKRMSTTFVLAALMGLAGMGTAWADSDPGDDGDSLTVTVTPDVNYAIDITTVDAHLQLGAVGLGTSTQTARPALVEFGGSVLSGHELRLNASIASAGTAWGFDNTPSTGANTSAESDKLAMYALFSSTFLTTAPTGDSFGHPAAGAGASTLDAAIYDGDTDSVVSNVRAGGGVDGGASSSGLQFEYHETAGFEFGEKDMDDNTAGGFGAGEINYGTANLWFFLRLPSATTSGAAQNVTVTLTHTLGDT